MDLKLHSERLKIALLESKKCFNFDFFGVGCVIFDHNNTLLSSSFTGERTGEHAEETAINKAIEQGISLKGSSLYSTLEPCSVRLSGKYPCAKRIIDSGIESVYFGCYEPKDFVKCEGVSILKESGIRIVHLSELNEECLLSIRYNRAVPNK